MLPQWIGGRWSGNGDNAIVSCSALWVGFYCFCGTVSRRYFDLLVDLQFAVGIGDAVLFSVGGLQLIVEVAGLRLEPGRRFKMCHCVRCLSAIKQNLSQLILCIRVVRMRGDDLLKKRDSIVGLRLLHIDEPEMILRVGIARRDIQLCAELLRRFWPMLPTDVGEPRIEVRLRQE